MSETAGKTPLPAEADAAAKQRAAEASAAMKPSFRHSLVGGTLAHNTTGFETMVWKEAMAAYDAASADIGGGDLTRASNMLTAQALTLDAVFTELLSRASNNIGKYPDAMERYMRLALKAQAQSRATIEALARMQQPREQIIRHVHVNEGGQAIVADQVTIGGPGGGNAILPDQSHATRTSGAGECPALLGPDSLGNGVPIASGQGPEALPNARRDQPRRSARKPKRAKARPADI